MLFFRKWNLERIRFAALLIGALIALAFTGRVQATSVQELVRLEGQGESVLQGFGLVVGLPGTGDTGDQLVVARPLAKFLESQGNPIDSFDELAKSRSVAVVTVSCRIPREGAKADDMFDVFVNAVHNPRSLEGGELILTPLRGPLPGQGVFAIAQGPLVIEGANDRRGRVRQGARITRPINMPTINSDGSITLVIHPHVAGWTTAQLLASVINDHRVGLDPAAEAIAHVRDERTVQVRIPAPELPDPASFIADVLSVRFDPSLMALPAKVLVNERQGVIVVTGEVQISPVIITHGDLVITTVTPPQEPTPENPNVEQQRWSRVTTGGRDADMARLQDLLTAFKTLDVPVRDQIAILTELHATGRLHAELVIN
ncbi:MAG: flagellar basal body P-ring protein FlgI [Phycisphaeraceae bacterium]|nr:MAG: flagellar basal body P-ring protein FlgI [Phycisphaeraceae bacterium]